MTTRTWNGTNDSFDNAAAWSPTGIPVSGDTAIINSGTVSLASNKSGVAIQLTEASGSTASTGLSLSNTTLDSSDSLRVVNNNSYNNTAPTVSIAGTVTLAGTESFYGSKIAFTIPSGSTLVNSGTMNFYSSSLVTTGGGTMQNSGTIAIVNPGSGPQVPVLSDPLTGTGTIALGTHARLELGGAVASSQTIVMNDGASGDQILQLDQVSSFGGIINGFSSSDLIAVTNTPYTNATYTSTGASSGKLNLFSGATLEGSIAFQGQYTLGDFTLTFNNFGGGQSNLQISTTAVNAQSSGLPAGYQNGGNGVIGAVYRFFDTKLGTHFFTADLGEKNDVIANRADLKLETNGFGDVLQSDPISEPVFRFFDTKFGTHFFTANAGERDNIISSRPDLTYEPSSTFYEHGTQQGTDVPVYRFFDTQFGTHFYTGDQGEYNGLTTPGTSTFRANLTSEGVEFYAPKGTFA